jgi:hypothetical protein
LIRPCRVAIFLCIATIGQADGSIIATIIKTT